MVATATSADIPAPSLDGFNRSVLAFALVTQAGTANSPEDYATLSTARNFPSSGGCSVDADAGNVQVCRLNVTFTPVDDALVEPDETLQVQIEGAPGASKAIQFQGPGPDRTVSSSTKSYPATIVSDDEFGVTGVDVTSTPQQAVDTYGAWEHIEISVSFNRSVTVTGDPTFTFELDGVATAAAYQEGSGTGTLVFSYQVLPGDSDSDGIAWAADALAGGAIVETGGTDVPTTTAFDQLALPDHKVDGTQTASGAATVSTVVVTSVPLLMASGSTTADTYGAGETIEFTVTFSAPVTVMGDPQFEFCLGTGSCTAGAPPPARRRALLSSGSGTTALVFRYRVQAADEDTNGIWVGDQSRTLKLDADDRILTASDNSLPASLTHAEQSTQGNHKVDGSQGTASPTLTLALSDAQIEEGGDTVTVTATVNPVHDMGFTVALATDSDRIEFPDGTTFTFVASATTASATLTVEAVDNDVDDGDVTIELTATPSVTAVAAPAAVELTVVDNDDPTVSIAAPTGATDGFLYEFEAATEDLQYQWLLTRAGLTDAELIVNVSVAETGGGDFAADGADTVKFAVNKSTTTYTPITADTVDEDHGTVTVTVAAGTGYAPGTASFASVAVRDDDGPLLEVSIDASITVPEGMAAVFGAKAENSDGTLTEARHLARLFSGLTAVAVKAQSADGTATVADSDYTAFDGPVALDTFEAVPGTPGGGRWTGKVSVQTTEDMVTENSQDFTVMLSLPAGTDARIALKSGDEMGTATITEGPSVTLTLSSDEDLDEGDTVTVTATVAPVHDMPFTVTLAAESNADRIAFPDGGDVHLRGERGVRVGDADGRGGGQRCRRRRCDDRTDRHAQRRRGDGAGGGADGGRRRPAAGVDRGAHRWRRTTSCTSSRPPRTNCSTNGC